MAKNILFFIILFYGLIFSQDKNDTYYYLCTANKSDKIRMRLEIKNNQIKGDYVNLVTGKRTYFTGTLEKNKFSIVRQKGKTTTELMNGIFKNEFKYLSGTMFDTNYKNKSEIKGELEATGRTVKLKEYTITTHYPFLIKDNQYYKKELLDTIDITVKEDLQFSLDEANTLSAATNSEEMKNDIKNRYSWETNIYIENISKNILSFLKINTQNLGGVFPNYRFFSKNYDKRTKNYKKIVLADLFKSNSDYTKIISDIILDDLNKQNASLIVSKNITDLRDDLRNEYLTYLILPKGLRFDFAPSTVGTASEGSFFVFIPYEKIKDIIDTMGILSEYKIK